MASGHVNRILKAEHMAAPTNAAKREESSCQLGAVHTWHLTDIPTAPPNFRYRGESVHGQQEQAPRHFQLGSSSKGTNANAVKTSGNRGWFLPLRFCVCIDLSDA
jgi:hypothetical protein